MEEMKTIPERISYIGRRMFERKLTDMAGGNISARDSDRVYMTPRYSGAHSHSCRVYRLRHAERQENQK